MPSMKECTLKQSMQPYMIWGLFLNSGLSEALRSPVGMRESCQRQGREGERDGERLKLSQGTVAMCTAQFVSSVHTEPGVNLDAPHQHNLRAPT